MARPVQQIVALGAGNTAGHGVGPANAWPAVIERLLAARGIAALLAGEAVAVLGP